MILATFSTGSFDFAVIDESPGLCRMRLAEAWKVHAEQTFADPNYFREYADDVNYAPITPGVVLRDGSPLRSDRDAAIAARAAA